MDSDDEYDCPEPSDLPPLPDLGNAINSINMEALLAGEAQTFEFGTNFELQGDEVIETDGYKQSRMKESKPIISHPNTLERVSLKHFNEELSEVMKIMIGDFTDLEDIMEPVPDPLIPEGESLQKLMLKGGTGKQVEENDLVTVHYMVSVESMDDLLESTYANKHLPKRFRVGKGEVLPMMDFAVKTMLVGETSKFLGTPGLAFGSMGSPLSENKIIPPDCRTLIQMEVIDARATEKNDSIIFMSHAERQELGFNELFKYATEMKIGGNEDFKLRAYRTALTKYLEALECIKDMDKSITDANREQYFKLRQAVCNNISQTYLKQGKFNKALAYAEDASKIPLQNIVKAKSFYLCSKALFEMGHWQECQQKLIKAQELNSSDPAIKDLLAETKRKIKEAQEEEKKLCSRMVNATLA